jgi:hypothetical protein
MEKMEHLGLSRQHVGLVVPSGYVFNTDGTAIYMATTAIFIAQALGIDLTWQQQAEMLAVAMVTSKGAGGVAGAGFIGLLGTLAVVPSIPPAGMALVLGVDRFMSEARALVNMVGNAVACVVLGRWLGDLDRIVRRAFSRAIRAMLRGCRHPGISLSLGRSVRLPLAVGEWLHKALAPCGQSDQAKDRTEMKRIALAVLVALALAAPVQHAPAIMGKRRPARRQSMAANMGPRRKRPAPPRSAGPACAAAITRAWR